MTGCRAAGQLQRGLQLNDSQMGRSDRVHGIRSTQIPMLRRTFITALAALTIALPAVAQRYQDDQARGSYHRGESERRNESGPRTERVQFPRDQWAPQQDRQDRQQREVPLSDILRDLRGQYGGQHLDAQKVGGRYRISWITGDGRRLVIEVDAATGRTISVRG
jgi:hypothetical protein